MGGNVIRNARTTNATRDTRHATRDNGPTTPSTRAALLADDQRVAVRGAARRAESARAVVACRVSRVRHSTGSRIATALFASSNAFSLLAITSVATPLPMRFTMA